jgi:carbon-monoxide dehydrogenase medium subunit
MTIGQVVVHRPGSLREALELFDRYGEDALPIAGGTELVLVMKLGLASARHLVDLTGVPQLQGVAVDADGSLSVGACTSHWALAHDPTVRTGWPSLARMERTIGNVRVQVAGTLGGNLAFADPESDPATYLAALDASLLCVGAEGDHREVPLSSFLLDAYLTALEPGALLGRIRVPPIPEASVVVHRKVAFGERPDVTCTVVAGFVDGRLGDLRVAIGSISPRPVRASTTELVGATAQEALTSVPTFAAAVVDEVRDQAMSDKRRPHKLAVARRLVEDILAEALQLANAPATEGKVP